jgi:type IV secretory pathway VirB2 component (pilin)
MIPALLGYRRPVMPIGWRERLAAFALALGLVSLFAAQPALAQANIEGMANNILNLLTGPLARTFATIALVVVGFLFFTGRGSMGSLVTVLVGVFIVFSARWAVGLITGSN